MYSKEEQQEQLYFNKVKNFLNSEIVRLKDLIVTYKARVKAQGEKFNEDNPNGGMYAGVELTELHYEMENQMQEIENAHYDISFYEKLKNNKKDGENNANPTWFIFNLFNNIYRY